MEARLVDDVPLTSPHPLALGPGFILYFWMSESSERTWSPGDCEGPGTTPKRGLPLLPLLNKPGEALTKESFRG